MKKIALIAATLLFSAVVWQYNDSSERLDNAELSPDLPAPRDNGSAAAGTAPDNDSVALDDRPCVAEKREYVATDGRMFSAYSCNPIQSAKAHPYEHYDNESLAELSWADAEAAALLGRRLAEHDRRMSYQLLLRATALDGDTRHLAWLGDITYGELRRNGELQVDIVKRRYELALLGTYLGDDPGLSHYLEHQLRVAGLASQDIDQLDLRAQQLLESLLNIQVDVFGEVRYGGQDNA